jgi:AbrB family looped-hinge helix DNA binding protein
MAAVKVTRNGSVTLPVKFRRALGLREGDLVTAELSGGAIVVRPARVIDAEDAWFYSKEWQAKEAEADADIEAGRVSRAFHSVDELMDDLEGKTPRRRKKR